METVFRPMQFQLAPASLQQAILPNWSFNLVSVNMGISSNAAVEEEALQKVGSYGKQLGHLAEALEVVIARMDLLQSKALTQAERDTLRVFLGDVAAVRKIKKAHA